MGGKCQRQCLSGFVMPVIVRNRSDLEHALVFDDVLATLNIGFGTSYICIAAPAGKGFETSSA